MSFALGRAVTTCCAAVLLAGCAELRTQANRARELRSQLAATSRALAEAESRGAEDDVYVHRVNRLGVLLDLAEVDDVQRQRYQKAAEEEQRHLSLVLDHTLMLGFHRGILAARLAALRGEGGEAEEIFLDVRSELVQWQIESGAGAGSPQREASEDLLAEVSRRLADLRQKR